jgi:Ino eighty subunit 1
MKLSYHSFAVFPEMKTALRTYHPVPSLQKTDGNAQDAPRIKNCLKAAQLPSELKTVPPSTPEDVLEKVVSSFITPLKLHKRPIVNCKKAGQRPPTTVVNLVFVLANHAAVRDKFKYWINLVD